MVGLTAFHVFPSVFVSADTHKPLRSLYTSAHQYRFHSDVYLNFSGNLA